MAWKQLVTPNVDIISKNGWCLEYVQRAYSAPWAGSSAWDAWTNRLDHKHADRNIPAGVYVPLWFDHWEGGEQLGHVVIYKDGTIWSSKYRADQKYAVLDSIEEVERIYDSAFVGWSKDIGGINVIEEEDMIGELAYRQAAQAAGFEWGKDFDYNPERSVAEFIQLVDANAPRITKEMESALADRASGIKNFIGWDDYNSPYVGQKVSTHYPQMAERWLKERKNEQSKPDSKALDKLERIKAIANE